MSAFALSHALVTCKVELSTLHSIIPKSGIEVSQGSTIRSVLTIQAQILMQEETAWDVLVSNIPIRVGSMLLDSLCSGSIVGQAARPPPWKPKLRLCIV
jgi:hypothetical protein